MQIKQLVALGKHTRDKLFSIARFEMLLAIKEAQVLPAQAHMRTLSITEIEILGMADHCTVGDEHQSRSQRGRPAT